jgi:hypothetical protein
MAYGIYTGIPLVPYMQSMSVSFSSFALGQQPLETSLDTTTLSTRTWINNISPSYQQPNVFAGNVFKTQYDAALRQAPGVACRLTQFSGPKTLLSLNFTPLENITDVFTRMWTNGWQLYKFQSIKGEFQLTQAPPGTDPNGPPYIVSLTFGGWQFEDPCIDDITPNEASQRLRKAGFDVPEGQCASEWGMSKSPLGLRRFVG